MTKEELEKEAKKYADGIYHYKINVSDYGEEGKINYRYSDVKEAYLASAEPREKQIDELKAQTKVLEQNLEDSEIIITSLKAQIEKMKVKIPLSMRIRNLFSPCRKCKKGIGYHCMYCKKSEGQKNDKRRT